MVYFWEPEKKKIRKVFAWKLRSQYEFSGRLRRQSPQKPNPCEDYKGHLMTNISFLGPMTHYSTGRKVGNQNNFYYGYNKHSNFLI